MTNEIRSKTVGIALVALLATGVFVVAHAQSSGAPQPPAPKGERSVEGTTDEAGKAPAPDAQAGDESEKASAEPAAPDPLREILRASDRETTRGRAELRDSLYALLATASDEKTAKRVAAEIQKLWLTTGSPTVTLLIQRANNAAKAKKNELALQFLDAAVDLAPDYAEAWNRRAFLHYQAGDVRRAVGDLRRALALDPNHFKALEGLGNIMRASGNDQGAFKAYERLIEVNPHADGAMKIYEQLRTKVQGRGI
jgi:tetratricopeptide (TPR) repeat protein